MAVLAFAVVLTIITLAIVFRDLKYSVLTTSPVTPPLLCSGS